ncbi:hypothetical protein CFC21_112173 [Triticum aestivum]|uniref:F-box domain-containing protein n=2 Tax=Triticum aestivum TaxID=4565 RepID=A0A9R0G490_WHEAT|nr:F-box/LRR-repeat protein At3g26922-like [Triticum aestivum]MBC2899325.1 hypothetical protein [Triticum aestivum]
MRRGLGGTRGVRGAGRLGALPDEVLQHVLSFLPSREAVHTSLLARRWRHQWKSAPALRITGADSFKSARELNDFVNYLIALRGRPPLHACEFEACEVYDYEDYDEGSQDDDGERSRYTDLWIRYALSCHARLLRIRDHDPNNVDPKNEAPLNVLLETPISSPHLTTLDLDGVIFSSKYSLDFSSCPNLETVKMHRCSFSIICCDGPIKVSSQSVKYLSITDYNFPRYDKKGALISVPNLVYLELGSGRGKVPTFECTPSLLAASIKLDDKDGSFLLERLSATINLELMIEPQASAAFRKELIRCTTFSKLKTLSLDDWCVEPDYSPLLYFLRRSPSLENLHLRLSKKYKHAEETDGSYAPIEPFLASKNLRVVKIKCLAQDERVPKIVKVLSSCGVTAELISINKRIWSSDRSYSDLEESNYSHSDSEESNYSHSDSEQEQSD